MAAPGAPGAPGATAGRFVDELRSVIAPEQVLDDPELMARYETDWTRRWRGRALAVVRPGDVAEVAAVLRRCADAGVGVVAQGGNTGLVGGGVPRRGEVVMSLTRLDTLGPVDVEAAQVTVGAGATLGQLQQHAAAHGLRFGVDLAARDSATVGGMIATNAGGIHAVRYGCMRAQTAGIEAVLANGSMVSRLEGLVKDNRGYDLTGLLCGSEGTLAVITAARLRLVSAPAHRVTALVGVGELADAVSLLGRLRALASLEAVEVMFADGIDLVCAATGLAQPFSVRHPCVVVVECAGSQDPGAELAGVLLGAPEVDDTAVASDPAGRDRLWRWRERHTEAVNALGVPHKLDVTVPTGALAAFEAEVRRVVASADPSATTVVWGHLGDGNLHVNVVGPAADDEGVDDAVLELVVAHGGSISAEHGIGVAKRGWLARTRSAADLEAMTAIKAALDPAGILNPGVLLADALR